MIKLARYLKSSAGIIVLLVVMLALQAWCELELPGYTSRLITQGIQQKGVEDAVPDEMSTQTMQDILMLADEETAALLESSYDEAEGRFRLNEEGAARRSELSEALIPEEMMLLALTSQDGALSMFGAADVGEAEDETALQTEPASREETALQTGAASPEETAMQPVPAVGAEDAMQPVPASQGDGMPQAPGTAQPPALTLDMLRAMPDAMREGVMAQAKEMMSQMPDMTASQMGIVFVQQEYERLGEDLGVRQNRYLVDTGVRMLLMAFLAMAAAVCVSFLSARMAARTSRSMRKDIYRKITSFNSEEFHRFSTASLITRSTNDVQQVQMFLAMGLRMLLFAPIMGIGGVIRVMRTNSSLSWIIALAVVIIMLLILFLFRIAMPKFTILQTLIDRLNLVSREQLTGVMVTRAFSAESFEEERFEKANLDLTRTNLFVNRCMTFMMPIMMLVMNGVSVLIVYRGAHAVDAGAMQVGDMMAFIQYAMQVIMSFLMISVMSILIPRANVAAKRILEVLDTEVAIKEPDTPKSPDPAEKGTVVFDHVSFAYPDAGENVLTDISFTAGRGQTIAFIGATGSGKSTLLRLILRFYDVTEGSVKVDGVDVREMRRGDLCARIGYVPQKNVLFSGTIASNILFGKEDAAEEDMVSAARIAQATEFIEEKEEGFQSPIAQGGTNVSGGQRQRLAIARAIAAKPEILLFDDSFSALDFKTDAALRRTLREEQGETTMLIVAQRISTIIHADQILVLDEGRVVGQGTHKELMSSCEVYRQIATSQLSEEELAG